MSLPLIRIIIYIRDFTTMKAFYQTHFNFPILEEINGEWIVFEAGKIELALHLAGQHYRKSGAVSPAPGTSTTKLVFEIASDLAAHHQKLRSSGVRVGDLKRYEGFPYEMYDGHDPEGNVFQIMRFD